MNTLLSFKWLNLFSFSPLFTNLLRTGWILIILKSHFNYCVFFVTVYRQMVKKNSGLAVAYTYSL